MRSSQISGFSIEDYATRTGERMTTNEEFVTELEIARKQTA